MNDFVSDMCCRLGRLIIPVNTCNCFAQGTIVCMGVEYVSSGCGLQGGEEAATEHGAL